MAVTKRAIGAPTVARTIRQPGSSQQQRDPRSTSIEGLCCALRNARKSAPDRCSKSAQSRLPRPQRDDCARRQWKASPVCSVRIWSVVSFCTKAYRDWRRPRRQSCSSLPAWAGAPRKRSSQRPATRRQRSCRADSSPRPFFATPRATRQVLPKLRRPNAPCQHRAASQLQEPRSALIHVRVRRERRRCGDARGLTDGGPRAFRPLVEMADRGRLGGPPVTSLPIWRCQLGQHWAAAVAVVVGPRRSRLGSWAAQFDRSARSGATEPRFRRP
jgi:hypothetical protein